MATSNDPSFIDGSLWGMYGASTTPANQFGSNAASAWSAGFTGSQDVVIGVIDEGIQITHPDLAANIWKNPIEIPGNGIDEDNNGYVDDVNGWDFAGGNNSVYDGKGDDHGTHVAGTIGGAGGNSIGVAGVERQNDFRKIFRQYWWNHC
jgi:subtilisin family serine protease